MNVLTLSVTAVLLIVVMYVIVQLELMKMRKVINILALSHIEINQVVLRINVVTVRQVFLFLNIVLAVCMHVTIITTAVFLNVKHIQVFTSNRRR